MGGSESRPPAAGKRRTRSSGLSSGPHALRAYYTAGRNVVQSLRFESRELQSLRFESGELQSLRFESTNCSVDFTVVYF